MLEHTLRLRVYYSDTDAQGIVYHANYLKFFDHGRTESLRNIGYDLSVLAKTEGVLFTVRQMNVEYLKPAYLDDELFVMSKVSLATGVRIEYEQTIRVGSSDGPVACQAKVQLVCLNQAQKPVRIPETLKMEITS